MHLEKYYLDIVTESGAGAIGYCANVNWGPLALSPSSTLVWPAEVAQSPSQRFALRGSQPLQQSGQIVWQEDAFGLSAAWQCATPPWREQVLWDADNICVRWQVLAAASPVRWQDAAGTRQGHGYAERLRIEGNPLNLPIDELHWGRFVSPQRNVTWIAWHSASGKRCWLWDDHDTPATEMAVTAGAVRWGRQRIDFQPVRTLRSGTVADTGLKPLQAMASLIPHWLLQMQETKWLSLGTLHNADGSRSQGWVIHEIVKIR